MKRILLLAPLILVNCKDAERRVATQQDSVAYASIRWPQFTPAEWSVYSQIIGKAMSEPLAPSDLSLIRDLFAQYSRRTGEPVTQQGVDSFLSVVKLVYNYNDALAANLLRAIDSRQPSFSREFQALRAAMAQAGMTRATKLAADSALIVSAAYGSEAIDEFGVRHQPPTRESVLEGMRALEIINANMTKLAHILRTFVGS